MRLTLLNIIGIAGLLTMKLQSTTVEKTFSLPQGTGSFYGGQSGCRLGGGDLPTIENKKENDLLSSRQNYSFFFSSNLWLGLYDNMSIWTWSLGKAAFENGVDFSYWAQSEPQLIVVAKICVFMDLKGKWFDELCTKTLPAVCYYEPGPAHYILVTTPMTWEQAQLYCRSNYTDLVSVRNLMEIDNIATLLTRPSWIGLYREGWGQWSDNSPLTFINFRSEDLALNQTSSKPVNCAVMSTITRLWSKVSCESSYNYKCQHFVVVDSATTTPAQTSTAPAQTTTAPAQTTTAPAQTTTAHAQTTTAHAQTSTAANPVAAEVSADFTADLMPLRSKNAFKLKFQSDTDLNDPEVQEQILHQLHDHLGKNDLGKFKLRWTQTDGKVFHKKTVKKKNQGCCG